MSESNNICVWQVVWFQRKSETDSVKNQAIVTARSLKQIYDWFGLGDVDLSADIESIINLGPIAANLECSNVHVSPNAESIGARWRDYLRGAEHPRLLNEALGRLYDRFKERAKTSRECEKKFAQNNKYVEAKKMFDIADMWDYASNMVEEEMGQ